MYLSCYFAKYLFNYLSFYLLFILNAVINDNEQENLIDKYHILGFFSCVIHFFFHKFIIWCVILILWNTLNVKLHSVSSTVEFIEIMSTLTLHVGGVTWTQRPCRCIITQYTHVHIYNKRIHIYAHSLTRRRTRYNFVIVCNKVTCAVCVHVSTVRHQQCYYRVSLSSTDDARHFDIGLCNI